MRLLSLTFLLTGLLHWTVKGQQTLPDSVAARNRPRPIFTVAEQPPMFPGGMRQLSEYIQKNLQYPSGLTEEPGAGGRVFVNFIVSEEGRIESVKALNSIGPKFDEEALRLVRNMPNWIPAKQRGQAVACQMNLPINFSSVKK